jgi:hypothetical protein
MGSGVARHATFAVSVVTAVCGTSAAWADGAVRPIDEVVVIDAAATGSAVAALTARVPEGSRARFVKEFEEFSKAYRELERGLGVKPRDPACAVAAFIVGGLAASNVTVPFESFTGLREQLGRGFAAHPALARQLQLDRGSVVEQVALLGIFLQGNSGRSDASARAALAGSARRYVQRYLGFDLGDVEVTRDGLRWVRGAPSGPLAVLYAPGAPPAATPTSASTYRSPDGDFQLTLPSGGWREGVMPGTPSHVMFQTEDPVMQAIVFSVRHDQTKDDFVAVVAKSREAMQRKAGKPPQPHDGTRPGGIVYRYHTMLDAAADNGTSKIFVAHCFAFKPSKRLVVEILVEAPLPASSSEARPADPIAIAADTICQSVE